jgi:DNA-directed RNA polymerase specialized sigma24 family protein
MKSIGWGDTFPVRFCQSAASYHESATLLRLYVAQGDEQAFGKLVARYVDLVYSAALRQVGGSTALAQDVVQTVFTDLARKAHSLPADVRLGGWLYRRSCFIAKTARRTESRRRAREQAALAMNESLWGGPGASSGLDYHPARSAACPGLGDQAQKHKEK